MITPFDGDSNVDWQALDKLIETQLAGEVEGLVPCGTTGESPTLSHDEHKEVIKRVVGKAKSIKSEVTVIAGTGSNSTREAISLTQAAAADGADYALVVNPYYNKPNQQGLYEHFYAIAEEATIPVVLYNIPGRTAVSLSLDTIVKLAEHPNVAAIKEATGDINFMTQVVMNTPDNFSLLSGDDNLLLPILSIGGQGVISVISNLLPQQTSNISRSFLGGDYQTAKKFFDEIFPLSLLMFCQTNPIPVKYAASFLGICENALRQPLTALPDEFKPAIDKAFAAYKN